MRIGRSSSLRLAAAGVLAAVGTAASPAPGSLRDEGRSALETVTADSLRGHLSFLASDALGGRVNGSPGLDIAAEYIAAQLRRAGLDPIGDDGYFQTAPATIATPRAEGFRFSISTPAGTVDVAPDAFRMTTVEPVVVDGIEVVKLPQGSTEGLESAAGRAVLTEMGEMPAGAGRRQAFQDRQRWMRALLGAGSTLVVVIDRSLPSPAGYFDTPVMVDLPSPFPPPGRVVTTSSADLARLYSALPAGRPAGRLALQVAEPRRERTRLRNVAGVLRGSDPKPAETYVVLSAHYDGTGPTGARGPDRVWNGANDDGSGTAAVIELASALSRVQPRPRRSIVFLAFFGEEKGLLGSSYYVAHPLVPLEKTVAVLNLEHLGRTDSTEGDKRRHLGLTGFDYSDLADVLRAAGAQFGIRVAKDPQRSDPFFLGSDNLPFARAGVVAHTASVLYEDFADYHGPGDEWPKIDFENMEPTVRALGAAALMLADREATPRWTPDDPRTEPFREAARGRDRP
jgi:hypothetical protein